MAIATDAFTGDLNVGGTPASRTISHTTGTLTDGFMLVCVEGNNGSMSDPTVTYNGVSATLHSSHVMTGVGKGFIFKLVAPASGTHDCVVTQGATKAEYLTTYIGTYSGVNQTTPLENETAANVTNTSITLTVTSGTNGSWVFGCGGTQANNWSSVSAGTRRLGNNGTSNHVFADSNSTVNAAATYDITVASSSSAANSLFGAAIAPVVTAANTTNFFQVLTI